MEIVMYFANQTYSCGYFHYNVSKISLKIKLKADLVHKHWAQIHKSILTGNIYNKCNVTLSGLWKEGQN